MPVFKAPDGKHYRFNEYDEDYIVPNSETKKKGVTRFNNEAITKPQGDTEIKQWNRNHFSTRKKVYRDIVIGKDELRARGVKYHKSLKPRKWYNW